MVSLLSREEERKNYEVWYQIVRSYSIRALTSEDDKLPAISGVAKEMHRLTGSQYLAGLWKEDHIHGIMWRPRIVGTAKKTSRYRAPSWSWASLDSPYEIEWKWSQARIPRQPQVEILSAEITSATEDPVGRVSGGHLIISGKLVLVSRIYAYKFHDDINDVYFFKDMDGGHLDQVYPETERRVSATENQQALLVMSDEHSINEDYHIGLVLELVGDTSDPSVTPKLLEQITPKLQIHFAQGPLVPVFRRIGCFHILHRDCWDCDFTFDISSKTVMIV